MQARIDLKPFLGIQSPVFRTRQPLIEPTLGNGKLPFGVGFAGTIISETPGYPGMHFDINRRILCDPIRFEVTDLLPRLARLPLNLHDELSQALGLYLGGFFKQASVSVAVTLETALKMVYSGSGLNLHGLIEKAAGEGHFNEAERLFLHELRQSRNCFVHDASTKARKEDAESALERALEVLDKLNRALISRS